MSGQFPRRLLPASQKEPASEPGASDPSALHSPQGKGVTRISTACEACKRRKSRCSGPPPPCSLCSAHGTECTIDESLDQRRRVSTSRLVGSSSNQRELLTALVQSIKYNSRDDVEELIMTLRDNLPASDTIAVLNRNIEALLSKDMDWPISLNELQMAYSTSLTPPSVAGGSTQSAISENAPPVEDDSAQSLSAAKTTDQGVENVSNQLKMYQRWIHLFGTEPSSSADSLLEALPSYEPKWHKGLWRNSSASNAGIDEEMEASAQKKRATETQSSRDDWHFALQIRDSFDKQAPSLPVELSADDKLRLDEVSSLIAAQHVDDEAHGGWVEILQAIAEPDGLSGTPSSSNALFTPHRLDFSRLPLHHVQTVTTLEDSPLSRVITDYRDAARAAIAQGTPPVDILGRDGIIVELFFRNRNPDDDFTVSNWAAELCRTFREYDIYVRLAGCLYMTYLMRWILMPTAKRYADVPDLLKPLPIQRIVAHHVAIDFLPIPALREGLVKSLRDFMTTLAAAKFSVNWPGTMDEAIMHDEDLGSLRLTEVFEKHVIDRSHFSIGRSVLKSLPELRGVIRMDDG